MPVMTILDRHIGRSMLYGVVLVFAILLSLFTFFDFVDKIGDLGRGNFGLSDVLRYLLLTLPKKIYDLFPMAALLGTTMGLSSLAVDSEMVAMRAAGVSLLRIVGSVMKTGVLLVAAVVITGEVIAPVSENLAQRGRAEALRIGIQQKDFGVWLRDGSSFINIGEVLPDLSLLKIGIYQFDENNLLRSQTFAERGYYVDGKWQLTDVSQSALSQDKIQIQHMPLTSWTSVVDPSVLSVFAVNPEGLSAWNLYRYIHHLKRNRQETGRYQLAFWYKIASPFTTAVMILLAIPFVFSHLRHAGMGFRLFIGILLGLGFYVFNRGFGYFSVLYGLPPALGVMLPTLLFFVASLYLLRRAA